jgi:hypothetical protein
MGKIILLLALVLLLSFSGETAETSRCRAGWIGAAEIGTQSIGNLQLDPMAFPEKYSNTVYAVIAIKLDPGRSLSIYDFTLRYNGRKFPCVALRQGDNSIDSTQWIIRETRPEELYSLLFILDYPALANAGGEITLELLYNLTDQPVQVSQELRFKNVCGSSFTTVPDILASWGKKPEPPPPPPPAPEPAAAPAASSTPQPETNTAAAVPASPANTQPVPPQMPPGANPPQGAPGMPPNGPPLPPGAPSMPPGAPLPPGVKPPSMPPGAPGAPGVVPAAVPPNQPVKPASTVSVPPKTSKPKAKPGQTAK